MNSENCQQLTTIDIQESDLSDCLNFFTQPLLNLIESGSSIFDDLELVSSLPQKLERFSLLLDLVGTECVKQIWQPDTNAQ